MHIIHAKLNIFYTSGIMISHNFLNIRSINGVTVNGFKLELQDFIYFAYVGFYCTNLSLYYKKYFITSINTKRNNIKYIKKQTTPMITLKIAEYFEKKNSDSGTPSVNIQPNKKTGDLPTTYCSKQVSSMIFDLVLSFSKACQT